MTTGKRPDGTVFASGAAEGEVQDFPSTARGWGVTIDGKDESGTAVTDATNGIPPMEWFNGLLKRIDENVWWLLQNALPDWLAGTWPKGAVVVNGDIVWRAQKETATEPTGSNGDWLALFPMQNLDGRYVPQTREINGHPLSENVAVTHQDIFGAPTQLPDVGDLNAITTPGIYFQPANANAIASANYPEPNAGALIVTKHAGISQLYFIYDTGVMYSRGLYTGNWSVWRRMASTTGDTFTGEVKISATDCLRLFNGDYGAIIRRSENNLYIIATAKGEAENGGLTDIRPFTVDLATGRVSMGHGLDVTGQVTPSDYTNFLNALTPHFQAPGDYAVNSNVYNRVESDGRYAMRTDIAGVGGVGTYALLTSPNAYNPGDLVDGSALKWAGVGGNLNSWGDRSIVISGNNVAGTWVACGVNTVSSNNDNCATLYFRIA